MSESAFSPEETLAPILLQDSYKIVFFRVYVTVINMLLMCWICTCFMELGVLALMFAPSYQLISCGSRDRGLLIALIIWCCSHTLSSQFLCDSNPKIHVFYQRQIFNAADDFVHNLNAMAVQCTFLIFDCIPEFDFQFHDTFGIIVGI